MKIMKRNGSEAAFDREKIAAAVTKANLATDQPPELSGGGDSGAGGDRD